MDVRARLVLLQVSFILLCIELPVFCAKISLIVADERNGRVVSHQGSLDRVRVSPCSTFKIALSLMGFDSDILIDTQTPEWRCSGELTLGDALLCGPRRWLADSVVWYSRGLVNRIGAVRIGSYLALFDYGNCDFSGDPGQHNGLTHAWLSSSLKISPAEQLAFIRSLVRETLPVSLYAMQMTKRLLFVEALPDGGRLFGKSGAGWAMEQPTGEQNISWFVGWAELRGTIYTFVLLILDDHLPARSELIALVKNALSGV